MTDVEGPLAPGVSVIVRSYRGVDRLPVVLASLAAQDLDRSLFEVLVVSNGPADASRDVVARVRAEEPDLTIRWVRSAVTGGPAASNTGLRMASREYLTFVDDDDWVSPTYLRTLLDAAAPDVVAHAFLADVDPDRPGSADFDTYVNRSVARFAGTEQRWSRASSSLSFNTAKIVATSVVRHLRWREDLVRSTDVIFWNTVANSAPLRLRIVHASTNAVYYRLRRPGSMSRPTSENWYMGVEARLLAWDALQSIAASSRGTGGASEVTLGAAKTLLRAISRYAHLHPEQRDEIVAAVEARGISDVPESIRTPHRARELVVSFRFPPTQSTASLVAARRVRERGRSVDVLTARYRGFPDDAEAGAYLLDELADRTHRVRITQPTSSWRSLVDFTERGLAQLRTWDGERGAPYERLYSRSMTAHSHLLAAHYRIAHPDVHWVAEFSDPLSRDVVNAPRLGLLPHHVVFARLAAHAASAGFPLDDERRLYAWIERMTYALADEILFTNEQQLAFMLSTLDDPALAARVRARATVAPQPTPPPQAYTAAPVEDPYDHGVVNVGYFGAFYRTRECDEVFDALARLDPERRRRVRVHVHCGDPVAVAAAAADRGLEDVVIAMPYVPYLTMLNLSTRLDALLVSDYRTRETHPVNPYLPAKWADYRGSGTPVWAIVEPGSVLSREPGLAWTSECGDVESVASALRAIVDAGPRDVARTGSASVGAARA